MSNICQPFDLWCNIQHVLQHPPHLDPAIFAEAFVEMIDDHIPIIGPFLDNPVVDAIEKNTIKNIVEAFSSSKPSSSN